METHLFTVMKIPKNAESYSFCLLIKAELVSYKNRYQDKFYSFFEYYIFIKNCFITLKNFKDLIQKSSKLLLGHSELLLIRKNLTSKLECIEYMRNKICGHIDDDFVRFAIMWNPHILIEIPKEKKEEELDDIWRVELLSKSMIESAINSYIVDVPNQTIFTSEIDLFYPPNYTELSNFVMDIINTSLSFLEMFSKILEKDINFYDKDNIYEAYKEAGLMDFGIKQPKIRK